MKEKINNIGFVISMIIVVCFYATVILFSYLIAKPIYFIYKKTKGDRVMKKLLLLSSAIVLVFTMSCQSQTNPYFRASWSAYTGAAKYIVLMEILPVGQTSQLHEDLDYLDPINLSGLIYQEVTTTFVRFRSPSDGKVLHIAVVVETAGGYYGAAAYGSLTKGTVPGKVGNLLLIKE